MVSYQSSRAGQLQRCISDSLSDQECPFQLKQVLGKFAAGLPRKTFQYCHSAASQVTVWVLCSETGAQVLLRTYGSFSPTKDSTLPGFTCFLCCSWKLENRTWVQVVELGDEPRKHKWGNGNVRKRRWHQHGYINKWVTAVGPQESVCPMTGRLGHWSTNFCPPLGEGYLQLS